MADVTISHTARGEAPPVRVQLLAALVLSTAMGVVLVARNTNDGPAWRVALVLVASFALVSWLVFGVAVRRTLAKNSSIASARAALLLGVITLLSVLVFWMALPPVFAIASFALASDARSRTADNGVWRVRGAVALAGVGLAAGLVLSVVG